MSKNMADMSQNILRPFSNPSDFPLMCIEWRPQKVVELWRIFTNKNEENINTVAENENVPFFFSKIDVKLEEFLAENLYLFWYNSSNTKLWKYGARKL